VTILLATADGLHDVDGPNEPALAGSDVTALALEGERTWALADGRQLWCGEQGVWHLAAELRVLQARCLAPTPAGLLVGTSEAHLLRLEDGRLAPLDAFEAAPGRDTWYTPWGGPPDTRSLALAADGTVYANVHVGGILRAAEPARAWTATIDIDADVHQVVAAQPQVVLAATARGLAVSDDGGDAWTFVTDGLHATYLRAVAVSAGSVLVAASTGPSSGRAAVYRRPLGDDAPFTRCTDWVGANIDTGWLAAGGDEVVCATPDGSVLASADEGATWTVIAEGLPRPRWVTVLADG
jgi:hypothetical protein